MTRINDLKQNLPYFLGSRENWKYDLMAGMVVALMALPMSLGIAIASGFPAMTGIITAIIGGLLVSFLAGSELTIKGPAGGLSAIAFGAIVTLGGGNPLLGYKYALATIVVAGFIQMGFGLIRLGNLGDFFPASTIHGMLAALGIIMAIKQVHVALGVVPNGKNAMSLLIEIPSSLQHMNPKIALIAVITLVILIGVTYLPGRFSQIFPGPLIAMLLVIPIGLVLKLNIDHYYKMGHTLYHIQPIDCLVHIPKDFTSGISLPDFSKLFTLDSFQYILMFALAGAIESLLSTKAIDKLDPYSRISNQNRDLFAVGFGTAVSGLLGGLPIISESKRSVININQGARTRWANFFHGLILVALVLLAVPLINLIPNASLAAMLIYTGARMAAPKEFSKSYKIGAEQFLVFIITFTVTMLSNFLIGVAVGICTELLIHLRFGVSLSALFKTNLQTKKINENQIEIIFAGPAIFSNYLGVKQVIEQIPQASVITFDFAGATVVDHTFMEHLHAYEERRIPMGGQIAISGLDYHKHLSDHPLAAKRIVKQGQLTDRQVDLSNFANTHGYIFDARLLTNHNKFGGHTLASGSHIKLEENIIKYIYNHVHIEISDILIEQGGANVIRQDYKMSVLYMNDMQAVLPEFTLQKEGFIETLFGFSGSDINFEDYPTFSYYYLLKGPNELLIRNFFKPAILSFFEHHRGFHMESKLGTVIIYKRHSLLSLDEIEAMNDFAQQFINTLHSGR